MGRHDVADDYEDDPEEPDESDMDSDEGDESVDTVECPSCGRDVYEQAQKCPYCGAYLVRGDSPRHARWVLWTTLVLLAVIVYMWTKRGSWF
jgi:hypothetical protein